MHVHLENIGGYKLFLTVACGDNTPTRLWELWERLIYAKMMIGLSDWLIGGDFSAIRNPDEQEGSDDFDLQSHKWVQPNPNLYE